MANEVYQRTRDHLSGLVSARAAQRILDEAMRRRGYSSESISPREMKRMLLGPVLRDLESILPRAGLRRNLREVGRVIDEIDVPDVPDMAAAPARPGGIALGPVTPAFELEVIDERPRQRPAGFVAATPPGVAATPIATRIAEPEPSGPAAQLPDEDVPEIDVPDEDVPEIDVPDEDVPDEDVPEIDLPDADVPEIDLPDVDVPGSDLPGMAAQPLLHEEPDAPDPERPDLLPSEAEMSEPTPAGVPAAAATAAGKDAAEAIDFGVIVFDDAIETRADVGDEDPGFELDPELLGGNDPAPTTEGLYLDEDGLFTDEHAPTSATAAELVPAPADVPPLPAERLRGAVLRFARIDSVLQVAALRGDGEVVEARGNAVDLASLGLLIASSLGLLRRHGSVRSYYLGHDRGQLFLFPIGPDTIIVVGHNNLNLGAVFTALAALEEEL